MINRIPIVLSIVILFSCCSRLGESIPKEKEYQIVQYLKEQHGVKFDVTTLVVFINGLSSACIPCNDELLLFLNELVENEATKSMRKIIVTNELRTNIISGVENNNVSFLIDTEYNLMRHGIDLSYNFLLELDTKENIRFFSFLTIASFTEVKNKYNSN